MPGLYLGALLVSIAGVVAIDARLRLALTVAPARTVLLVAVGTIFFLVWDVVGIATGVFLRGDSPALLGIDLAPHLPLEEPVFLAFLSYLAVVVHAFALRPRGRASAPEEAS